MQILEGFRVKRTEVRRQNQCKKTCFSVPQTFEHNALGYTDATKQLHHRLQKSPNTPLSGMQTPETEPEKC